jgi:hypothetical protein
MNGDWGRQAGFDALVIAGALGAITAREAVEAAGGRATVTGWADAATALTHAADVLLVEAEEADEAALTLALPAIAAVAWERPVIVALAEHQIDEVAGALIGSGAQLLCRPDLLERVAALLVAAGGRSAPTGVREDDRDRLRRLNGEIARIADVLAQLSGRADPAAGEVEDRRGGYDAGPDVDVSDPEPIRQAIRARRLRDGFFPAGLFEDPAWDMLLDLFAAELEGTRVSVSSLCIAAAVAPTTALRWIGKMTEAGLLQRVADPQDRRRAFMGLTERAQAGMRGYLGAVSRQGLWIA